MTIRTVAINAALAGLLLLGMVANRAGFAMGGYTPDQVLSGSVQSIDYLHHTITVNGQIYTVSPSAKYNGVAAFSILNIGMPIQFMLGDTASGQAPEPMPDNAATIQAVNQPQMIISITWLPAGIQGK